MRNTAPAAKLAGAAAATCISRFTNAAARRLLTSARTACTIRSDTLTNVRRQGANEPFCHDQIYALHVWIAMQQWHCSPDGP